MILQIIFNLVVIFLLWLIFKALTDLEEDITALKEQLEDMDDDVQDYQ